jgi:hypothetical protein
MVRISGSLTGESPRQARRRRGRSPSQRLDIVGAGLLVLAVAGSALAFGAQHTSVLWVAAAVAAAAAVLLRPKRVPAGSWLLLALGVYSAFQLVPLPFALLEWLSPASANVWRGAFSLFGARGQGFAPLTVDPGATALEVLKWTAYACTLSAAVGLRSRYRSVALALLVFGSALLVCLVTLAHGVLNLEHIYGVFRPTDHSRWVRGPFVNGNNLAGYLNLGLFAGAGLAVSRRIERGTPLLLAGVILLGAGSLLASSRGGTLTLFGGAGLFSYLMLRGRSGGSGKLVTIIVTTALVGFALAAAVSGRRVFGTLLDTQVVTKISIWRWTLDLIADAPWFGVGRGGFESAFQPYRHPLGVNYTQVVVHAECFPLQWAADWGVPVTLAALLALAFIARRTWSRAHGDPIAAGLFTGLIALGVQNLTDLGLELFSVMAAALVSFAGADEVDETPPSSRRAALAPVATVALGLVLVVALGATPPQVERQRAGRAYGALARASRQELRAFRDGLEAAFHRHPGDPYLPLLGGLATWRIGGDPLPWLGRALERSPLDGNVHLALSDVLARRGARQQSLLHARFTALYAQGLREQALSRIAARVQSEADLFDSFPVGLPGSELLAETCEKIMAALRVTCWREALSRQPKAVTERALTAALLSSLEKGEKPCVGGDRKNCVDQALGLLDRLEKHAAGANDAAELRARLLVVLGNKREAALLLLERCPGGIESKTCLEQALDFAIASGEVQVIERVAARYVALVCGEPHACAALHERLGRAYADLATETSALRHFLDAAKRSPTLERWLLTAESASRLGSSSTAELALARASREPELGPAALERIEQVKARLSGQPLE